LLRPLVEQALQLDDRGVGDVFLGQPDSRDAGRKQDV
jgi:hypothetical protein